MSQLKELLGELFTPEIEAKIGNRLVYLWNKEDEKEKDKEPIPKFRVNEMLETSKAKVTNLEAQIETLTNQSKDYDKQLKELKKAAEGNVDLQAQIQTLQDENKNTRSLFEKQQEDSALEIARVKKKTALILGLNDEDVTNPKHRELLAMDIISKIGLDKIELDENDRAKNMSEIVKPYKEDPERAYDGMFGKTIIKGQEHGQGGDPEFTGEYLSLDQIGKMTKEQVAENRDKVNKSIERLSKQ